MRRSGAVGLDIGTSAVRAAEVSFRRDAPVLRRFGQVALPAGAVRDGEVMDVAAVADALRALWAQVRFSSKDVVLGVANSKVVVRQVDLPAMPRAELKASLAFHVQESIPMPVETAELDVLPLAETVDDQGVRRVRGLLVAADRAMVLSAVAAAQQAGLTATAVDLQSFALLRSVGRASATGLDSHIEAIVDVGARVTNVVVHDGGVPQFVRLLLLGGQDVTDAVAERFRVPAGEAEALKQALGIAGVSAGGGIGVEDAVVRDVVRAASATLVDEVRHSLDYHFGSAVRSLHRVVLTGGGSRLAGLAAQLETALQAPVVPGDAIAPLQVGATGLSPEQITYLVPLAAVPVGLALGAAA